jgi:Emfourin
MRVTFQTEGGVAHFPGLSQPVTIETDQMPEQDAAELRELMGAARLLDRPAHVGKAARGAADYRQHTITVEADGRRYTVRLTEPVEDPDLQRLLRFLQDKAKELRTKARAGGSP